jgi:hypothetical protein
VIGGEGKVGCKVWADGGITENRAGGIGALTRGIAVEKPVTI